MKTLCSVDGLYLDGEYTKNKKRISGEKEEFPGKESMIPDAYYDDYSGILMAGGSSEGERSMRSVSHGSTSVIGRRRSMEDAVTVAPGGVVAGQSDVYDFFAVYDGHGGARVANACKERMHQLVANELIKKERSSDESYWGKVMTECFKKMDDEVTGGGKGNLEGGEALVLSSENTVGSTALVVMVGKEELVVANCGDSRTVLCRGGVAVALSRDHKPDRPHERERVEAAGGRVVNGDGNRVLGVLGTSRSIGDQYLRPCVTSEAEVAEVTVIKRTGSDEFVVIGTDGLWDVISNEFACEVVKKCLRGQIKHRSFSDEYNRSHAAEAAAMLAQLAMAKGSKDNISVVVIEL
ncbi:protein phosphatase 2c, putative [Ricinus communis]|uniref:protein-serine/threonine phosphatase n=2 Tax=Ricinus communis TaxID=3988 RepID=B9RCS1_RICCO|nr:protein phosphatase 2c, putative [Ricinus communis]